MEGMQLGSLSYVPTELAAARSIKKQSFPEEPSFDCNREQKKTSS